jgi:hypothetical protein
MRISTVIAIAACVMLLAERVRGDTMEAFALGSFMGLVVGGALGIAFAYGEHERRHGGGDHR